MSTDPAVLERIESLRLLVAEEPEDALGHFMLGQELQRVPNPPEAEACFRRVIELDREYTAAYKGLARCLVQAGNLEEAAEVVARGLAVAEQTGDLQTAKEMEVLRRRYLGGEPS